MGAGLASSQQLQLLRLLRHPAEEVVLDREVRATVAADHDRDLDELLAAEQRIERDQAGIGCRIRFAGWIGVRAMDDFHPAFRAVDPEHVSLPRRAEVAGIRHRRAAAIAHRSAVGVLDLNLFIVNVAPTVGWILHVIRQAELIPAGRDLVARGVRLLRIVLLKHRALALFLGWRQRVSLRIPRANSSVGAIVVESAEGEDIFRDVAQPPVDEIEVVAALVDAEPAGHLPHAVPPVVVTRPVPGIEVVGELDVDDAPEFAAEDHPLQALVCGRVAVVVGHAHTATALPLGLLHAPHLLAVDDHRLLGDHVTTGLEPRDDMSAVGGVRPDDDQRVRPGFLDHPLDRPRGIEWDRGVDLPEKCLHSGAVDIQNADQLGPVGEIRAAHAAFADQRQDELIDSAGA